MDSLQYIRLTENRHGPRTLPHLKRGQRKTLVFPNLHRPKTRGYKQKTGRNGNLNSLMDIYTFHFCHASIDHFRGEKILFTTTLHINLTVVFLGQTNEVDNKSESNQKDRTNSFCWMCHVDWAVISYNLCHIRQSTAMIQMKVTLWGGRVKKE